MKKGRSTEQELMDDLHFDGKDLKSTLEELDFINFWLGGQSISVKLMKQLMSQYKVASFVDLGCGSGHLLRVLENKYGEVRFTGIDANPHIIDYAKARYAGINFECQNIFDQKFSTTKYDVIHCCLFLHHFTSEQLVQLFKSFKHQAQVAILVNDLHRHPIAYWSIALLTALFSKSKLVRHDAKLSVSRGFKRIEVHQIMKGAGIQNYQLKWKWAFRWELIIYT